MEMHNAIHYLLPLLSLITLLIIIPAAIEFLIGIRSIKMLKNIPPVHVSDAPKVSVIIAARNEEKNIEEALASVLKQDYPHLEIIVVNDRSTDRTGIILDRMALPQERIQIFHVTHLPEGWLGKNHALYYGTKHSDGEIVLFTDADVVMEPSAVSRAVGFMVRNGTDHMTVAPEPKMCTVLLSILAGYMSMTFGLFGKPWKVNKPKSRQYVGIGAFNMLRADVYRAIGTHKAIAMRPDDDIKLGKLVKKHGFRQEGLLGKEMISVEWYCSIHDYIVGLTKNSFAAIDYNLALVIGATVPFLLLNVWPFLAMFLTGGFTWVMNTIVALTLVLIYGENARFFGIKPWYAIGFPIAALFLIHILWRSALVTIINQGINWRGTTYPLDKLKANKV